LQEKEDVISVGHVGQVEDRTYMVAYTIIHGCRQGNPQHA
jgi:hypothetical protein